MKGWDPIWMTLLDKGVLALVGTWFVWFLNSRLEKLKATEALANEFAKSKLAKIADIWDVLYRWEFEIRSITIDIQRSMAPTDSSDIVVVRLEPFTRKINSLLDGRGIKTIASIRQARYLTGDQLHDCFINYAERLANQLYFLLQRPEDATLAEFEKSLDIARNSTMRELSLQFRIFQRTR